MFTPDRKTLFDCDAKLALEEDKINDLLALLDVTEATELRTLLNAKEAIDLAACLGRSGPGSLHARLTAKDTKIRLLLMVVGALKGMSTRAMSALQEADQVALSVRQARQAVEQAATASAKEHYTLEAEWWAAEHAGQDAWLVAMQAMQERLMDLQLFDRSSYVG